ncbi:nuclear RNA export factor 1-like isoform X2 [Lycorma delicatula]|uniref:nuclear RNA export factor 1-like isoform X2 n=1 Tax=Lycorma delicatula TaxID=130591 RepID=UPI003F51544E
MPNMHKRGRDRGKHNYYEHDDRDFSAGSSSENVRRVSFKGSHGREGRKWNRQGWDQKLRVPYNVGGRGPLRGRMRHPRDSPVPTMRKILQESSFSWYKVTILFGGKYDQEYVLRIVMGYIRPHTFVPYGFTRSGEDVSFFVDDFTIAEQIMNADRKITANDGNKLRIHVRSNAAPFVQVDDKLKEKLKVAMSRRYQTTNKALDLHKFHADPEFIAENILFPLNRVNLLQAVVQIICESIPELQALDLSDNKLQGLDCLKPLVDKTPQLKVLHIAKNKIRYLNQMEYLYGLPLEDLNIDGNPVCDKFKDQSTYVREVRKRFPKVIKLDGIDLPPPITFDVEDDTPLIPSKGSFLCDLNGSAVIKQFLEQYYTIFDSDSRQPLIDAYHENAQFSLTCTPGLTSYLPDSRNLLLVSSLDKRQRLLRQGRSSVISFLTSLIKTQHDPSSFAVDLLLFTPQLISLSVTGVYREPTSSKKLPIRSFSRVFVIVPAGSGFCIINDLLSITNASPDQAREAFKVSIAPTPAPAPVVAPHPQIMVSPDAPVPVPSQNISSPGSISLVPCTNVETQQQMIAALAMHTGMNLAWSEKCLNETNWNYDSALYIFSELNKQGKVPSDAFIK